MIAVDAWLPSDGLTLEPNALRAAKEQARCLALTAGPGAGKTEMLAQRADFLLRTGTCRYPKRILAISFKVLPNWLNLSLPSLPITAEPLVNKTSD